MSSFKKREDQFAITIILIYDVQPRVIDVVFVNWYFTSFSGNRNIHLILTLS